MHVIKAFFLITLLFEHYSAILKSCWNETDQPRICYLKKDGYVNPFPIILNTTFFLKEIVEINEDERSISIQMNLNSEWYDPGLQRSNGTKL